MILIFLSVLFFSGSNKFSSDVIEFNLCFLTAGEFPEDYEITVGHSFTHNLRLNKERIEVNLEFLKIILLTGINFLGFTRMYGYSYGPT